jgi:hypothetical protein
MMAGSETRKAEKKNSSWTVEGKRLTGGPRRRWDEMLKRILKKQDGRTYTGFLWLMIGAN